MQADLHHAMRHLIDKSLAGEASSQVLSPQEQHVLGEHLRACAQCESYASDGRRAIAALSGFSFAADPGSQEKIHAALALRARQLQATEPGRIRMVRIVQATAAALLLTIAGSFGAAHMGDLLAAVLHLPAAQAHTGLLTFWIAPSWCFSLLLPVLLFVSARSANRKGQIL
jgi:anti-sigma factor RsiW